MFRQMFVVTSLWFVAFAVVLFAAAGTLDWPRGWAFLLEMAIFSYGIGAWLAVYDPELLEKPAVLPAAQQPRAGPQASARRLACLISPGWC